MIFKEICDNIIEIGMLEVSNEMATFADYSIYESYFTEASESSGSKKKNIIVRAFEALINMFTKLGEKIASLFKGDKGTYIENAVNNLKTTSEGKAKLSKKINFTSFTNTKKFDKETADRLMAAKSTEEIERIMTSYRKQRNTKLKVAAVAIGTVATVFISRHMKGLKSEIDTTSKQLKKYQDSLASLTRKHESMMSRNKEKSRRAGEHIKNLKQTVSKQQHTMNQMYQKNNYIKLNHKSWTVY